MSRHKSNNGLFQRPRAPIFVEAEICHLETLFCYGGLHVLGEGYWRLRLSGLLTEAGLAPSQRARVHSMQRHLDTLAAQFSGSAGRISEYQAKREAAQSGFA